MGGMSPACPTFLLLDLDIPPEAEVDCVTHRISSLQKEISLCDDGAFFLLLKSQQKVIYSCVSEFELSWRANSTYIYCICN